MNALKCAIEVKAGIIPGEPMPEMSRRWIWTSEDQEQLEGSDVNIKKGAQERWIRMAGESREYAAALENPASVNWVERTWIWY